MCFIKRSSSATIIRNSIQAVLPFNEVAALFNRVFLYSIWVLDCRSSYNWLRFLRASIVRLRNVEIYELRRENTEFYCRRKQHINDQVQFSKVSSEEVRIGKEEGYRKNPNRMQQWRRRRNHWCQAPNVNVNGFLSGGVECV